MLKQKKSSRELRALLWEILGGDGSRLLLEALAGDCDSCLVLADVFLDRGDQGRAQRAREACPTDPARSQNLESLHALLLTLPSLATAARDAEYETVRAVWYARCCGATQPDGGFLTWDGYWTPSAVEDMGHVVGRVLPPAASRPLAYREACLRLSHVYHLWFRGMEGHAVPRDIRDGIAKYREKLIALLLERLEPHLQDVL